MARVTLCHGGGHDGRRPLGRDLERLRVGGQRLFPTFGSGVGVPEQPQSYGGFGVGLGDLLPIQHASLVIGLLRAWERKRRPVDEGVGGEAIRESLLSIGPVPDGSEGVGTPHPGIVAKGTADFGIERGSLVVLLQIPACPSGPHSGGDVIWIVLQRGFGLLETLLPILGFLGLGCAREGDGGAGHAARSGLGCCRLGLVATTIAGRSNE